MIKFTKESEEYLQKNRIREIFLVLKYIKGPCNDNLCKMIPKVEIALNAPRETAVIPISDTFVKVFAVPPISKAIKSHKEDQLISLTRVRKRLKIEGIPYAF